MLSVAIIAGFILMVLTPCLIALRTGPRLHQSEDIAPVETEMQPEETQVAWSSLDPRPSRPRSIERPGHMPETPAANVVSTGAEPAQAPESQTALLKQLEQELQDAVAAAHEAHLAAASAATCALEADAVVAALRTLRAATRADAARLAAQQAAAIADQARATLKAAYQAGKPKIVRREAA